MKAVILAGGYGTRISEETGIRPKPMVEIGGMPILWHIMKIYSHFGINEFVICLGYKGEIIKEFFSRYVFQLSNLTIRTEDNSIKVHDNKLEPWVIHLIDTGEKTMTGGRIRRIKEFVDGDRFCMTYGDGVTDVDVNALIQFHLRSKRLATLTAVKPPGRFGVFNLDKEGSLIETFKEKPRSDGNITSWINGGFFVLEPEIFNYIEDDDTVWEKEPMERLATEGQLAAFRHEGYWQNMDTLNDKKVLENEWKSGNPKWKIWK